jgi:uncharacterized protein
VQVVVVAEDDDSARSEELYAAAVEPFAFSKTSLRLLANQAVAENLPRVLAETIPHLPTLGLGKSFAVLCSGSTCQPPIFDAAQLRTEVEGAIRGNVG